MTLKELAGLLTLNVIQPQGNFDVVVTGGYTSDLLSDVMGNAKERNVWITCQTHENIAAVAKLKNLAAIILVNGRKPDEAALKKAREEKVVILGTPESEFAISGVLYNHFKK
ncbi:MAG: serine kinase [Candidatus Aminicenantes bacterium]|nr:serine kinase [Candidatus Aminicenantes bacterium]